MIPIFPFPSVCPGDMPIYLANGSHASFSVQTMGPWPQKPGQSTTVSGVYGGVVSLPHDRAGSRSNMGFFYMTPAYKQTSTWGSTLCCKSIKHKQCPKT